MEVWNWLVFPFSWDAIKLIKGIGREFRSMRTHAHLEASLEFTTLSAWCTPEPCIQHNPMQRQGFVWFHVSSSKTGPLSPCLLKPDIEFSPNAKRQGSVWIHAFVPRQTQAVHFATWIQGPLPPFCWGARHFKTPRSHDGEQQRWAGHPGWTPVPRVVEIV